MGISSSSSSSSSSSCSPPPPPPPIGLPGPTFFRKLYFFWVDFTVHVFSSPVRRFLSHFLFTMKRMF